jgi:acetyl esterase/lipase
VPYAFDPELAPIVDLLPTGDIRDLAQSRQGIQALLEPLNRDVDTTGVLVSDHQVATPAGPVPVRVYAPAAAAATARPALLDIHGGGFVVGSIDMEHAFATRVARRLDAVVVTPEYRLAPEHLFPAALDDCYATLQWLHAGAATLSVDPERVAVGGQSAGGGLAAAVALLARDRGGPKICFQYLGIPELDHRLETPSMRAFVDTPMWHRPNAELSWSYYLGPDVDEVSPYASPSIAPDLSGLPPAYVTTMEFDPLRDEGIHYALRMMQAGVSVELHSYPGTFHGSGLVTTAAVSERERAEVMVVLERGLRAAPA